MGNNFLKRVYRVFMYRTIRYISLQVLHKYQEMALQSFERIPQQTGHLLINENGGVISSGGDLENNEHVASVIFSMVKGTDKSIFSAADSVPFKRCSIHYDDYFYVIGMSNKRIHVVKRENKSVPREPVIA